MYKILLKPYRKLKLLIHKIRDYDRLYDECNSLSQDLDEQYITNQSIGVRYNEVLKELEELKAKKSLTSKQSKYDYIELPKLPVEEIKKSLKMADNFTINTICEYMKADYYEFIKSLGDNLSDENKQIIAVASNAVRRRTEAWIQAFSKNITKETYVDRMKGEIKDIKK